MRRGSKKPFLWISARICSMNTCFMPGCSQMETRLPLAIKELRVWWGGGWPQTQTLGKHSSGAQGGQARGPESVLRSLSWLISSLCSPSPRPLTWQIRTQRGRPPTPIPPAAPTHLIPAESDLGWSPFTPRCSQKVLCLQGLWEIPSFLPAWGPATLNRFSI